MKNISSAVFVALGLSLSTGLVLADAPAKYAGLPYQGKPISLPGIVQAEEYDIAPDANSGVTFNYNRPGNKNDVRKTPDAIGMARCGQGHVSIKGEPQDPNGAYLGWTQDGEWTKYSVHVSESGVYRFGGQFAAAGKDAKLSATFTPLAVNGAEITTGAVEIPTTDGYQPDVEVYHVWEKLDGVAEINLPRGDYLLMVKIEKNAGLNLDYFSFTKKP
jgi:hypothetical protein